MIRLRGEEGRDARDQIPFILSGSPNERWLHTCDACVIRDGPLENLSGGGRAKYKKNIPQGKIKWQNIHARQLILKNIHAMA